MELRKGTHIYTHVHIHIHARLKCILSQELAGNEVLEKPWNYGKADRIVKDLVEVAGITTELQKQKLAAVIRVCVNVCMCIHKRTHICIFVVKDVVKVADNTTELQKTEACCGNTCVYVCVCIHVCNERRL